MKKQLLSGIFLILFSSLMAQYVDRTMVVLEQGTSVNCVWCPSAAKGAQDLLNAGCQVAVIASHTSTFGYDPFANTYSMSRVQLYGWNSWPSAIFDGAIPANGGSASGSTYTMYLPKYTQRKNLVTHITMSMEAQQTDAGWNASVTMIKVGNLTATNLKLFFFITESYIPYTWYSNHLEFVTRLMAPDQNGTPVDFTSSDTVTVQLNFTTDPSWPVENLEFVACVQSMTTKEIQQAIKRGAIDLTVDFEADVTQVDKNGQVSFTNNTVGGYLGNVQEIYHWEFPGATPDTSNEENPVVTYTECGPHDVSLNVWRGGQTQTIVKTAYIQVGPVVTITTTPGDSTCWYEPITLDATTPNAISYLWVPGGYTTPSITVNGGSLGVGSHEFTVTVTSADGCITDKSHTIYFDACTGFGDEPQTPVTRIYPNPSGGKFTLELSGSSTGFVDLQVINTLGIPVYEENHLAVSGSLVKQMKVNIPAGVYFVVIQDGDQKTIHKLIIQ
jgi:PKD repeat protein